MPIFKASKTAKFSQSIFTHQLKIGNEAVVVEQKACLFELIVLFSLRHQLLL
jgi:hypothetical protein